MRRSSSYHVESMPKLGRILTLVFALVIGLGLSWAVPMSSAASPKATEMHAMMAGMDASSERCGACADEAGAMQDCLAPCMSFTAIAQHDGIVFLSHRAGYGSVLEQSFGNAGKRPDPYPPRSTILI